MSAIMGSMSPTVVTVVAVVVTVVMVKCVRWWLSFRSYFNFFESLPGETEFSCIWGNFHKFRNKSSEEQIDYMGNLTLKHPKFYRLWMGPFRAAIYLNHPESVRELLKTTEPKPFTYRFALPWLGNGLLIAGGSQWARSRRLLTPAFHFDILKPYVGVGNKACDILLGKVKKSVDENKSIEMFSNIALSTLDVLLRCAMSYDNDVQVQGESHPYVQAVTELTELWDARFKNPLVHNEFIYHLTSNGRRFKKQCDFVHSLSERVIAERQKSLKLGGPPKKRYLDFLDILLTAKDDTGVGMTDEEIRAEVDTFMFEGHDTTASAISWILYALCQHPDHQTKVQQEIDTVLKGRDSDNIEWADIPKLEYMSIVIKEGMRLHPPVPLVARELSQPATVNGVTLPVGTFCMINIMDLHHNPVVWADPWTFRPDRFLPDNTKNMDSYAYVPFSAGPRNCIGQHFALNEEKVMLGRLLRRYTFKLDPAHTVEKKIAAIMRTVTGMNMIATPRTPTV